MANLGEIYRAKISKSSKQLNMYFGCFLSTSRKYVMFWKQPLHGKTYIFAHSVSSKASEIWKTTITSWDKNRNYYCKHFWTTKTTKHLITSVSISVCHCNMVGCCSVDRASSGLWWPLEAGIWCYNDDTHPIIHRTLNTAAMSQTALHILILNSIQFRKQTY